MTKGTLDSENGWVLPTSGTLNVLVVYAEIDYLHDTLDPNLNGTSQWPVCDLSVWANDRFDTPEPPDPQGSPPRYYRQAASRNLNVMDISLVSFHTNPVSMDKPMYSYLRKKLLDPEMSFSHL